MKEKKRSRKRNLIMKMAAPLLCGLFFYCLMQFVLLVGYVPTASMEPVIQDGSWIVGTRIYGELQRGDIVIFRYRGAMLVKRIAGIPGDVVSTDDGTVLTVPDGCYYLLGDNPSESFDSRQWHEPFISESEIVARLLW